MRVLDSVRRTWNDLTSRRDPVAADTAAKAPSLDDDDFAPDHHSPEQSARIITFIANATAVRERPLYTDNQKEVGAERTPIARAPLLQALAQAWPELGEEGARTLHAQYVAETGGGRACYNYNLGNLKQPDAKQPHTYLRNVWEVLPAARAASAVVAARGSAARATVDQRRARGWTAPPGHEVVVFQPPHPATRFKAFTSLDDAARAFVSTHRRLAERDGDYLANLRAGDAVAVAHALKSVGYYTGSETAYARRMKEARAQQ
jgi:hypothetical protein